MLLEEQFSYDTTNTLLYQVRELLKEQNSLLKQLTSANKQETDEDKKPIRKRGDKE